MLIVDKPYFQLEVSVQKAGKLYSLEIHQTHPKAQNPRRQRITQLNLTPADLAALSAYLQGAQS